MPEAVSIASAGAGSFSNARGSFEGEGEGEGEASGRGTRNEERGDLHPKESINWRRDVVIERRGCWGVELKEERERLGVEVEEMCEFRGAFVGHGSFRLAGGGCACSFRLPASAVSVASSPLFRDNASTRVLGSTSPQVLGQGDVEDIFLELAALCH